MFWQLRFIVAEIFEFIAVVIADFIVLSIEFILLEEPPILIAGRTRTKNRKKKYFKYAY